MLTLKKNEAVTRVTKKQSSIRELEVNWYVSNYTLIVGQAGMLAGFCCDQLGHGVPTGENQPHFVLELGFLGLTSIAMALEVAVIAASTYLGVWGEGN
jgi:hypothetical protein